MAGRRDFHKVIIGRSEAVHFVDLDIQAVPAKTDTGAYCSAVDAANIHLDKETNTLSFDLLGGHPLYKSVSRHIETQEFGLVWVESSSGHGEHRYEVKLKVRLGPKVFMARFSLADRSKRIYPILLGRKLLNERFLVDPSESGVDRAELKAKYGVELPKDEEGEHEDSDSIEG
jgi:hypothetical protein